MNFLTRLYLAMNLVAILFVQQIGATAQPIPPYYYVGCLNDYHTYGAGRVLPNLGPSVSTVAQCAKYVYGAESGVNLNTIFFGLQDTSQCWYGTVPPNNPFEYGYSCGCTSPCSGNASEMCGGNFVNSLYTFDSNYTAPLKNITCSSSPTTKFGEICQPKPEMSRFECLALIEFCELFGIKMKWNGILCPPTEKGKQPCASGCQCDQYCGHSCESSCKNDEECYWKEGQCFNVIDDEPGWPIPICFPLF